MKFKDLYKENIASVEKALYALWCGESANESQKAYIKQLKGIIRKLFAPETAYPVAQCMNSYRSVYSVSVDEAKELVSPLWNKEWSPYEHQYQCWHTLLKEVTKDNKPMSICVTTGTGSGKTECFMLPLVYDLLKNPSKGCIQALFLYPLNALMEDQKERLEELLSNTDITYTVYNGDLPEVEPKPSDNSDYAISIRHNIEQITGGKYSEYNNEDSGKLEWVLKDVKFPHMLYTRKQVRATPPNIILTNPTMLEYILLRRKDSTLTNYDSKSLRWVTIDETHSYSGAGAAELAMLLRRVLIAFGCNASNVRFATSSATFGNDEDDKEKLQEFISGITGVDLEQVKVIGGSRVGENNIPNGQDKKIWKKLFDEEYVALDKLFPGKESIEDKLQMLDDVCYREECRCKENNINVPDLKVKLHYYYRVPNNGLYVKLNDFKDGCFKIFTSNIIDEKDKSNKLPLLELSRCKHCGEYVAVGRVNVIDGTIEALEGDDSDMFDLEDQNNDQKRYQYAFFALSNKINEMGDNNIMCTISSEGKLTPCISSDVNEGDWHLIANTQFSCPYCGVKQGRNADIELDEPIENFRLRKFRISADFISRLISPSILNQLEKNKSKKGDLTLHDGQQYISFVDSRQAAAKATLSHNLEQERLWFYNVIFQELNRRQFEQDSIKAKIDNLSQQIKNIDSESEGFDELVIERKNLRKKCLDYITWQEIADLIYNDKYFNTFCNLFVTHTRDSEELDENGLIREDVKRQYIQSLMVMYLANKLSSVASNETMGLFHSCYPQIKNLKCPVAVENFNKVLKKEENKISDSDWQDLIQIFMDYTVRSNQSFFLQLSKDNPIDIFSSIRFATQKPTRRPINKPVFTKDKISRSRIVMYLSALIAKDDSSITLDNAQKLYFQQISEVIDALWETLTDNKNKLLQNSTKWDRELGKHVTENVYSPRLNLVNLSFKLYKNVSLCDTNTFKGGRHTIRLRPIENNFKGFSPYLEEQKPVKLNLNLCEEWNVLPYKKQGEEMTLNELHEWAKKNRKLLWNNGLWGNDGIFATYLNQIYLYPNLFLQAEHTAQVDKFVARDFQNAFKDHTINILACSTTMEMGVDLGNLEVVLLSSIPPMPANYKQRAGRSGRNNKVKSACITLCSSDAIGLRTLYNPIDKIIFRPVHVPTIDLMSPQVVQRHVNSFLIRYYGVFTSGKKGGDLNQKVVDYFTPYRIVNGSNGHLIILDDSNSEVGPSSKLGDSNKTLHAKFNEKCLQPLSDDLKSYLTILLKATIFENKFNEVVDKAREENERCYAELFNKASDLFYANCNNNKKIPEKFRTKLKMQYMELLNQTLLNFWATNRFTPNANMPVNVLTLDINTSNKSFYTKSTSSNPSYPLRQAIAQYAPGNSIAVDGVVYTVRGIGYTNMYKGVNSFKTIYRNNDKTVIDDISSIPAPIPWFVNDKIGLELIQPVSFLPDKNESRNRILDRNAYTRVSAQLIDVDKWVNIATEPHLFSVRSSRETGAAKILYYNEGKGYGYCFCMRCGRMVLEDKVINHSNLMTFPVEFNPNYPKKRDDDIERPKYHFAIAGKDFRTVCTASNNPEYVKRNIIIGGLIQTDFTEIRIRHRGDRRWISNRSRDTELLYTLGIVFTQSLADVLGKERTAIDFSIMPNGHLCIFDTNPGGAGYSNQLSDIRLMNEVIDCSEKMLKNAKQTNSKDVLLDKFTLRYLKYLDVDLALSWIEEEKKSCLTLPKEVKNIFPDSSETSLNELLKKCSASYNDITLFADNLFFDNDMEGWNYNDINEGWQAKFLARFSKKASLIKFCLTKSSDDAINEPIRNILRGLNSWMSKGVYELSNPYANNTLYPLAYVDGCLYFTNNRENSALNNKWGSGTMYIVKCNNPAEKAKQIDLTYHENAKVFKLDDAQSQHIYSKELGQILYSKSSKVIDNFINAIEQSDDKIVIEYQDEHLKSVLGIVLTLQVIEFFINKFKKEYSLEFLIEKYSDYCSRESINSNLTDNTIRDKYLIDLTNGFLNSNNIHGELIPVKSEERKTLTHWRVLRFKCGENELNIYPDGGFANGWYLDVTQCDKYYTIDNTDVSQNIPIMRNQALKFEVDTNLQ